ncbi:MAG: 2-C-methyl-D-erythritol 2,4-cyclodiphosphate synthase, partial [Chitinophagaceae bacterium]
LLERTIALIKKEGYSIVNMDTSLCLEEPKIKSYTSQMRKTIAGIAGITEKDISIKATTAEKMGFVGREEGLMAYATVLLEKIA